jgi:putative ABC transport system substrate-binding protein
MSSLETVPPTAENAIVRAILQSTGEQRHIAMFHPLSRRSLISGGGAALLASPVALTPGIAQPTVVAGITPIPRTAIHWIALFDELRKQGFAEGVNLTVQGFGIAPERLDAAATEFVKSGVQAILTGGAAPTRAAMRATTTIPILTALDDFIGQGFVTSISRPGGNITGVSIFGSALDVKRLELLVALAPRAQAIALLADPASTPAGNLKQLEELGRQRNIRIVVYRAGQPSEIGPAIEKASSDGAQAFNVLASQFFNLNRVEIIARIGRLGIPAIYQWPEWVSEGALIAYGPRFATVYRQIARQLAKVLKGTNPADIAVEQPTAFELVINLKVASQIGLAVPADLLFRADTVIE